MNQMDANPKLTAEPEFGWLSGPVKCMQCGFEQVSVWHESCDLLECGRCGEMACSPHDWTKRKPRKH